MSSVDAATCYDRMAHAIISLCTQRLGMLRLVITLLLMTIQWMQFYLQTGFGDSEDFYGRPSEMPLQGCCQGNGGGPAMWVLVAIPLVENLHKNGHMAQLHYAYSGRSVNTAGNLYMDDIDFVSAGLDPDEPLQRYYPKCRGQSLHGKQGGLRASGGDLKWTKSEWCSAKFIWNSKGQWRYKQPEESPGEILIKGPHSKDMAMQRLSPNETKVAVGTMQVADGSMEAK